MLDTISRTKNGVLNKMDTVRQTLRGFKGMVVNSYDVWFAIDVQSQGLMSEKDVKKAISNMPNCVIKRLTSSSFLVL